MGESELSIKAVLFDLDGVLVDACEWHYEALNQALKECGYPEISRHDHILRYNGLPTNTKLSMMVVDGIMPASDIEVVAQRKQEVTATTIKDLAKPDDVKITVMKGLKDLNIAVACVTNSIHYTAELMLKNTGQLPHIQYLVSNERVERPKPNPEGYLRAMVHFGLGPADCLIVEDSDKGFQAAQASGAA